MSLEQRMQLLERDANRTGDALDQLRVEMNQRFDGIEQRLDRLEERFGRLEQRFDGLEGTLAGYYRCWLESPQHRANAKAPKFAV